MILRLPSYDFIICPTSLRRSLLESLPQQLDGNHRFYSKEQLFSLLYFSYDERAIYYLMEHLGYSYQIALDRLSDLYFLPSKTTTSNRINDLVNIYNLLEQKGLLVKTKYFPHLISGKTALVIGYQYDDELTYFAKEAKITLQYVEFENKQQPLVYEFETIKEEIHYRFNQIALLIDQGVNPSDITIICSNKDMHFDIKLASLAFNIPVNNLDNESIGQSGYVVKTITHLKASRDFAAAKQYAMTTHNLATTDPLITLIDEIAPLDISPECKIKIFEFKAHRLSKRTGRYIHGITLAQQLFPQNHKHVFVLGASQGIIPHIYHDIEYLSDAERDALGRLTSTIKNKIEYANWSNLFLNQPQLEISYHKMGKQGQLYPSPLIAKLGLIIVKPPLQTIEYGQSLTDLKGAALLDEYRIYQIGHPQLEAYQTRIGNLYQTYDFRFRPFSFGLQTKRMQLSYTAIKTFYQCRFRYYLQYLLKLNDDSDNFYAKFGEFAHDLLQRSYEQDFDFETTYADLYAKYLFTAKEQVLLIRLKQDLFEVINFNRDHEANMNIAKMYHEQTIKFRIDDITSFKGKIDKIWVTKDEAGTQYLAVVDYKTSNEDFDARKLVYGHSLQLPTYGLLLANDELFADKEVIGYYIQNIIASKLVRPLGKDPTDFYREQLRLCGLSTSDINKLATLDKDYIQSKYIKTIATIKNGELKKSAKVADSATFLAYKELALTKITEAIKTIRDHQFDIDPKRFSQGEDSCTYCPFRDICFRNDDAYIEIKLTNEEATDEPTAE